MIKATKLTKAFGDFTAVDSLDLQLNKGEIYGFLGPNGAGKTTTIKMLTGTLKPTTGIVEVLGMSYKENEIEIKKRIGVIPDEPRIYSYFTGMEFINFIMDIFPEKREIAEKNFDELTNAFNIDFLNNQVVEMSHGMKQKLMLLSVLMRKPEVIFLDEPTVGLDAKSAKILKLLLNKYKNEGSLIFMTTHVLEIAEKMCDRIGIINNGILIAEGNLEELREKAGTDGSQSLEDLFLKLTDEGENIREIINNL
ncbi:MAG: ABC transporter ATP-binding protein [Kosmotoga sp.]|nr:MAG: ABC transporter ATP-binding protein [Kosmotoga sp.]